MVFYPISIENRRYDPSKLDDIIWAMEVVGLIVSRDELERRRRKLRGELARAVEELKLMGAERIVLIGSMADGDIGPCSDIDLVVVMQTEERFLDRLKEAYGRIRPSVAMDILIYSPDEIDEMYESSAFLCHVLEKGRVLYAA
ncbi:MAG: nucleotidyltransferase domain-containing protein [Actinobacteria bacterium]|nr:nucleotidyltransferase domain-containing protein [Actinomycetota bacterium]